MYEHKNTEPISTPKFLKRLVFHFSISLIIILSSIVFGMLGYFFFEHLSFSDAFLNSAMLLGGMGPVNPPVTLGGKIFAGCFALYSGLIFLIVAGIILAPAIHRILHKFHWEQGKTTR